MRPGGIGFHHPVAVWLGCALILAGGGGTRLRPLSRPDRPKPFLPLLGDETLVYTRATVAPPYAVGDLNHDGVADHQIAENQGSQRLFAGIVRDVTEKKKTEEQLRHSEESFRLLVDNVRDYATANPDQE